MIFTPTLHGAVIFPGSIIARRGWFVFLCVSAAETSAQGHQSGDLYRTCCFGSSHMRCVVDCRGVFKSSFIGKFAGCCSDAINVLLL